LIAEAWDAAGLYRLARSSATVGRSGNGQYRDDARRFIRATPARWRARGRTYPASPDLYPQEDREPNRSINFITCHEGFTLNDLVSYTQKHNEANREQ
jgi:glycogen operon protein